MNELMMLLTAHMPQEVILEKLKEGVDRLVANPEDKEAYGIVIGGAQAMLIKHRVEQDGGLDAVLAKMAEKMEGDEQKREAKTTTDEMMNKG